MTQVKGTLGKDGSSGLMSAEELKGRLQQHFAKSGTLNNLKTQLRNQLVTELFKVAELPTNKIENEFSDAEAKKTLLPLQVSNWLVHDHLKREGYDYSLSTFVTEASVSFPEKLLSLRDVLDLLGFKSESEESETITEHYIHCKHGSFLHSLLQCVMKQHKKHNLLDLNCKAKKFKENADPKTDGNVSVHQQQLYQSGNWIEQRNELPRSKLFDESQNDSEMHQQKLYHMLQSGKEGQESEVQRLRQKLLSELDRLYEHEQHVRLELEQRKSHLTREQELLDIEKNKLRAQEMELRKRASLIETENAKIYIIKEERLSALLKKKEEELAELEDRLKQQEHRLSEERQILNNQRKETEDLRNQLQQSEKNCQHIQNEYSNLLAENALLKEKVENATDYEHVKTELLNNLKEAESCKMEIKEIKERSEAEKHVLLASVKNLEEQLRKCLQKANSMKDVGVSTETSCFQDESVWNQQKDRLEQELSDTKQLYHEVLQKLQEQNEDIQDLHLAIHVLHDEISDPTNRSKPIPKAEEQNSHPVPPPGIPGLDIRQNQLQRTFSPHTQPSYNAQYPGLFNPSPVQRTLKEDPYKFISEARKRISDLEQEAQAVKKKYSIFVASQLKLPPPSYIAYGNAFHNYDTMNTNQNYNIPGSKGNDLSLMQTAVTNKHDNNHMTSFTSEPYFVTSHHNNNEKTLMPHDSQDAELARNFPLPHDRHVWLQNDEHFVPHKVNFPGAIPSGFSNSTVELHHSAMQKLNTYPNNKENNLQSHVQIGSSHKHPVCSDHTSVPPVSHVFQFSEQVHDNGEQFLSTANSVPVSHSQNMLRHASIDHPFHLSKFGLYSTGNKTVASPLITDHSQVQPNASVSKSQMGNGTKKNGSCGESLSQEHSKMSKISTLNNKSSQVNHSSNVNKQSFLESELSSEQDRGQPVSVYKEQFEAQVPIHSLEQTKLLQNVLSEQVDSDSSSVTQSCSKVTENTGCQTASLNPNKSTDPNGDVKKLGDETLSLEIRQNFGKVEDDTSTKTSDTKPKSNEPLRRLSVDLDSAWRQQTGSMSPVVKNFMRPRSSSSHSLPSRFGLAETSAVSELKTDMKQSLKCDEVIEKEVSSPRSHSFSETHLLNVVEKIKHGPTGSDTFASADGMTIHRPLEDLRNQHNSIPGISNHLDVGNVKDVESPEKHNDGLNLDSTCPTKQSNSTEVIEKEEQLNVNDDSHASVMHEGNIIKQSGDELDHDSSSSVRSLPHISLQDDESIASSRKDVPVPSKLNEDVVATDFLHVENSEVSTKARTVPPVSDVDNHQESAKNCENEADSVEDHIEKEKSASAGESGDGDNCNNEGGHDESVSELSELNLSAGNEELEGSKSEESGW